MTDRHAGYVVALKNVRDDDAVAIVNALKMVKGVVGESRRSSRRPSSTSQNYA